MSQNLTIRFNGKVYRYLIEWTGTLEISGCQDSLMISASSKFKFFDLDWKLNDIKTYPHNEKITG